MRLIDADKLINLPFERLIHTDYGETAVPLEEIDNAPTVEVSYLTNCANCERVEKIRAKRPQGKWLDVYVTHIAYECSCCHRQMPICDFFNFCPNCGAQMEKGDKEGGKA